MCTQCMLGASAAVGGASGLRAWLATRTWAWLTPAVLKRMTVLLLACALLGSTLLVSGPSSASDTRSATSSGAAEAAR